MGWNHQPGSHAVFMTWVFPRSHFALEVPDWINQNLSDFSKDGLRRVAKVVGGITILCEVLQFTQVACSQREWHSNRKSTPNTSKPFCFLIAGLVMAFSKFGLMIRIVNWNIHDYLLRYSDIGSRVASTILHRWPSKYHQATGRTLVLGRRLLPPNELETWLRDFDNAQQPGRWLKNAGLPRFGFHCG